MKPEEWVRVKSVFRRVLDLPPSERSDFLDRECLGNATFRGQVDHLIEKAETEDDFDLNDESILDLDKEFLGDFDDDDLFHDDLKMFEQIGEGSMGVVYRAHQVNLGRDVAVKLLSPLRRLDPRSVDRFRQEARAAAKLTHPGIVPILFDGEVDGTQFLVMELVRGESLHSRLEEQLSASPERDPDEALTKLDPQDHIRSVAEFVMRVAEALEYAHSQGIIHRDIKPRNILIGEDGRPHIADFGIARDLAGPGLTKTGAAPGTPAYMSPEQASSKKELDHRTDIFSLGIVLYEMLALRRPFNANSHEGLLAQIKHREPPSLRKRNPRVPRDRNYSPLPH